MKTRYIPLLLCLFVSVSAFGQVQPVKAVIKGVERLAAISSPQRQMSFLLRQNPQLSAQAAANIVSKYNPTTGLSAQQLLEQFQMSATNLVNFTPSPLIKAVEKAVPFSVSNRAEILPYQSWSDAPEMTYMLVTRFIHKNGFFPRAEIEGKTPETYTEEEQREVTLAKRVDDFLATASANDPLAPAFHKAKGKYTYTPQSADATQTDLTRTVQKAAVQARQQHILANDAPETFTAEEKRDILNVFDQWLDKTIAEKSLGGNAQEALKTLKQKTDTWKQDPDQCPEEYAVYFSRFLAQLVDRGLGHKQVCMVAPNGRSFLQSSFHKITYRGRDPQNVKPGDFVLNEERLEGIPLWHFKFPENIHYAKLVGHNLTKIKLNKNTTAQNFQEFIERMEKSLDDFYQHTGDVDLRFGLHELGIDSKSKDEPVSGEKFLNGNLHIHFMYSNDVSQVSFKVNIDASSIVKKIKGEIRASMASQKTKRGKHADLTPTYKNKIWQAYREIFSPYFTEKQLKHKKPYAIYFLQEKNP